MGIFAKSFPKNAFFEPIKYLFFKYLQLSHIHTSFKHAFLIIHFLLVSENTLFLDLWEIWKSEK